MSMSEFFNDLDPKIAGPLERITEALRAEISSQIESVRQDVKGLVAADRSVESPRATENLDALEELKRAAAGIDSATEQAAILTGLLEGAGRFSSRAAFVLIRDDGQRCWDSVGFDVRQRMQGAPVEVPNGDSAWSRIGEGAGTCGLTGEECAVFCSQFEATTPIMGALLPLSLGDHVAGYLYADRVGDGPLNITALQLLTFVAGQTLETLPVRKRTSTPALTVAEAAPATPAEAPAVAEEIPEAVAPAEAEAEPEPEPEAEPEPVALETAPVEVVPEAAPEAAEEADEAAPVPLEEPEAVAEEPAAVEEPAADADFYEVEAPEAEAPAEEVGPPDVESVDEPMAPAEAPTAEMPIPAVEEPAEPPVEEPAPVDEPPPPAAPAEPVVAPPPTPAMDGSSTQVMPPDDVRGPGWAFTARESGEDTGNEALHEEARRLARLLVTEIKLYNEEQVDQGRRSGDIYRRLQEDIDRSRQIFEDRIDEQIRADNDYFKDALIRILAGGDESLLGM